MNQQKDSKTATNTGVSVDAIVSLPEWILRKYSETNGAYQVWFAWYWKMCHQGRDVKDHKNLWDTLPERDKELDEYIAMEVVRDFLVWLKEHPEEWQKGN